MEKPEGDVRPADDFKLKICLLGDPAVGKTSLVRRFVLDLYSDKYLTSLGVKVMKKVLHIQGPGDGSRRISLMIWDLFGQRDFKLLHESSLKGSHGILLVCDITRERTAQSLLRWNEDVHSIVGDLPSLVFVNKSDLASSWEFEDHPHLKAVTEALGAPMVMTSAKTGANVEEGFAYLSSMMTSGRLDRGRRRQPDHTDANVDVR